MMGTGQDMTTYFPYNAYKQQKDPYPFGLDPVRKGAGSLTLVT